MPDESREAYIARRAMREFHILRSLLEDVRQFVRHGSPPGEDVREVDLLTDDLQALRKHLCRHFELEEQDGALFDDIEARVPAAAQTVETLKEEHPRFLEWIERLLQVVESRPKVDLGAMREELGNFLDLLEKHERTENDLFQQAYFLDEAVVD